MSAAGACVAHHDVAVEIAPGESIRRNRGPAQVLGALQESRYFVSVVAK
jgi:hypothetical protein